VIDLTPIGIVQSSLTDVGAAPLQGDEGAPDCRLEFEPAVAEALEGLQPGDHIVVVTWLHQADRSTLQTHPRGDVTRPPQGVFSTRSPDRPNPVGLHVVEILAIEGTRLEVRKLEAVDGTPILDVKPVLASDVGRR